LESEHFEGWDTEHRFDAIFSIDSLDHGEMGFGLLPKIAGLLAPGGRFYLFVHLRPPARLNEIHDHALTIADLDKALALTRLKELRREIFPQDLDLSFDCPCLVGVWEMPTLHSRAVQTLRVFDEAATMRGLRWCLLDGTLLGAVRDSDFCLGDEDDIDIGVFNEDFERVGQVGDGLWFRITDRLIYKERVENVKMCLDDGRVSVDIRRLHRHPTRPEVYNIGHVTLNGERVWVANVYDAAHFDHMDAIYLHDVRTLAPSQAPKLLDHRYGSDWRIPVHRDNWDWTKRIPNNCIRTEYDQL
jgi:hypothetical protein